MDMSKLRINVESYPNLGKAHELSVRKNELYVAMKLVESCGASRELTDAVTKLGERMRMIDDWLIEQVTYSVEYPVGL